MARVEKYQHEPFYFWFGEVGGWSGALSKFRSSNPESPFMRNTKVKLKPARQPTSDSLFTISDLSRLYAVPPETIRLLIDRLNLGTRLGNWRVVTLADLERLETGLVTLGYEVTPQNPPPRTKSRVPQEAAR
jgi:hypothetical protein